jgi:hypothetical protein
MLPVLVDFLNENTSPEEKHLLMLADETLVRANDDNYEHVLQEIVYGSDDMDAGAPIQEIVQTYRHQLFVFLQRHAIVVKAESTLEQLTNLVNGILDLDNYDNPQQLLKLIDEDTRLLEKACIIFSQVTRYTTDDLLQFVESVAEGFIERLGQNNLPHDEDETLDDADARPTRELLDAFRRYEEYTEMSGSVAMILPQLMRGGVKPSLPYAWYVKMIDNLLPLSSLAGSRVARELYGAALISSDGHSNPADMVKNTLELYISDIRIITDVMVEVRQLMAGFKA